MRKSIILGFAASALLVANETKVNDMNDIIFQTQLVNGLDGLTKSGGKYYRLNTKTNTAVEITPETVTKGAKKALKTGKDVDGFLSIAEEFGLIETISFVRDGEAEGGRVSITNLVDSLDMKITDVTVEEQNAIIFKTAGIAEISNLTKDGSEYYQIDTRKNTATLIEAAAIAKQAKKDLMKGKVTDFTVLADNFCLISAVSFERK